MAKTEYFFLPQKVQKNSLENRFSKVCKMKKLVKISVLPSFE